MNPPTAIPDAPSGRRNKRDAALWFGVIVSAILHFLFFSYWPEMQADELLVARNTLTAVELPPQVEIPDRPEAIARPATPVVASAEVGEDVTIAPTTFEANPVRELPLPPPPEEKGETSLRDNPTFTPYTVRPRLLNAGEIGRILQAEYPPLLREAGIGGSVRVWFFLDTDGRVLETRVEQSSGHPQLDQAALRVAGAMRFSPALNRDREVQVWVRFPIVFQIR